MKKQNNVIIIGCSIPSLYAAIKFLDGDYKVTLIEKKNSILPIYESIYHNFNIYNDNHKNYINLLNRFNIKTEKINIKYDIKFIGLIKKILYKSKPIPNTIIASHTFANFCKSILSDNDYNILIKYEQIFSGFFNVINALDCINIFSNDIVFSNIQYYNVSLMSINELIKKMLAYIITNGGEIIYNNEVKTIRYIKKQFVIGTSMYITYMSDILLTTISRDNLFSFQIWNDEQKLLFNTVSSINSAIINNIFEYFMLNVRKNDYDRNRKILLDNLHIVFPLFTNKSKHIYIWNNGINNVLIRERIKNMYNNKFFICSESYSKNTMFVNYSLESIDNSLNNILPKS